LHTIDGKNFIGPLGNIGADWSMRLTGTDRALVPGNDVVSLHRLNVPLPAPPVGSQLMLTNGDRIPLDPAGSLLLADEQLHFRPLPPLKLGGGGELKLPIALVAAVWLRAPDKTVQPERFIRRLLAGTRTRDLILLHNGDRVEGSITALDRRGCKVKIEKSVQVVPAERIAAIAFSTELLARVKPPPPFGRAILTGGGRITLLSAGLDAGRKQLTGKTIFRAAVEFPMDRLAGLEMAQGRVVYLSDLYPAEYVFTPFLGISWPYTRDGSIAGLGLALKDLGTLDRGLGLHTGSRITYSLDRKYQWFEAWVGVDPEMGRQGSARVAVIVDGKRQQLGGDREMTVRDAPVKFRIGVSQARRLTLQVTAGSRGDVQGHVNWGNARLIKAGS
jgi:hypothetical protein